MLENAWEELCDRLRDAGRVIVREGSPTDPLSRAEGFRYVARLARTTLESFLEHDDPLAPVLHRVVHETAKLGSDNPDNYFQYAAIDGTQEYRLRGSRGTVHYLGFGTQAGRFGQGVGLPLTGFREASELQIGPDGSFELVLSSERQPGNWLPMQPETGTLMIRQTFLDKERERRAELTLERIGGKPGPSPVTPERVERGLRAAGNLVAGATMLFASWAEQFRQRPNELPLFDPAMAAAFGGDPNAIYHHGYYRLAPGEALVIDFTPPECDYWNFQLNNHWMESLDYRYFKVAVNKRSARLAADGSVRIVVAAEDRGFANFIDTVGHEVGTMCLRILRGKEQVSPCTRVVALDSL